MSPAPSKSIDAFIARWTSREGGAERANYQMFLTELCEVIGVDKPDPAEATTEFNDYLFERHVRFLSRGLDEGRPPCEIDPCAEFRRIPAG